MADDTPPEDLVQARRAFLAADAELSRLAAAAPSCLAEDGSVVGADPQFAALMEAQRETMRQKAEFIAGHRWMTSSGTWYASWLQVDRAAKSAA